MIDILLLAKWAETDLPLGWKIVGVSSDNEIFVEFSDTSLPENETDLKEKEVGRKLRKAFPELTSVIFVVKPSLTQVKEMVEQLNQVLKEDAAPKKNLLSIGDF